MSTTQDCCSPCSTLSTTSLPGVPGADGATGAAGNPGANAFTTTSTNFPIPGTPGSPASIPVNSNAMFQVGQIIFVGSGTAQGTFKITVKSADGLSLTGTWLAYAGDSAATTNIPGGSLVVSGSTVQTVLPAISDYHLATSQKITTVSLQLLSSKVTLTLPGTYLLITQARLDFAAASFNTSREVTLNLTRTNNGPGTSGGLADAKIGVQTAITVTATATLFDGPIPAVVYTTTNAGDIIQLFGSLAVAEDAGALNAISCSILAIKLF